MNHKKPVQFILITMIFLISLSCRSGYFETEETVAPSEDLASKVLKDVVITMQNNFPPAKTKLFFRHKNEKMALNLEIHLRRLGYGLVQDLKDPKSLRLGYKFGELDKDNFILNLVVGDEFQITRLYSRSRDGDYITAGPMMMRRGS